MRRFSTIAFVAAFILFHMVGAIAQEGDEPAGSIYVAREGETVLGVSQRFDLTVECIQAANDLAEDAVLEVGQQLLIPEDCADVLGAGGGAVDAEATPEPDAAVTTLEESPTLTEDTTYTVVAGDRLSRIAQNFGVTVDCLVRVNRIANPNLIFVGQELQIPVDCLGAGGGEVSTVGSGGGLTGLDLTCQFDRYPNREAPDGQYTIRAGDTLDYIACDFGISLSCLLESNPQITNNKRVAVGSQITINTACPAWDGGFIP